MWRVLESSYFPATKPSRSGEPRVLASALDLKLRNRGCRAHLAREAVQILLHLASMIREVRVEQRSGFMLGIAAIPDQSADDEEQNPGQNLRNPAHALKIIMSMGRRPSFRCLTLLFRNP